MRTAWVVHVNRFPTNFSCPVFKYCTRDEIYHVIARKFQRRGRTEILARGEIRHVIGPLVEEKFI